MKQDREAILHKLTDVDALEAYVEHVRAEAIGWCAAEIDSGDVDVDTLLEKATAALGTLTSSL